jgi:hypothetical protein
MPPHVNQNDTRARHAGVTTPPIACAAHHGGTMIVICVSHTKTIVSNSEKLGA